MNRQQDLFEIDIFYNIINVFTVSFELILDDKSIFIFFFKSINQSCWPKILNRSL